MTSNIDIERDAALGRIFREMIETLATVEKGWLDKKSRTAKDFRQAALEVLMIIDDRFRGARNVEPNSLEGYMLRRLMYELATVAKDMPSTLLSPDNSRKNKGRASNNLWGVHAQSAAIRVHDAMIEFRRPVDQAAKEVAACFHVPGVKMNAKPVTAATIKEWSDARRRTKTKLPRAVTDQLLKLDEHIDALRFARTWAKMWEPLLTSRLNITYEPSNVIGYHKAEVQGLTFHFVYEYSEADRAGMLLDWLGNFIRTTACD